MKVFIPAEHGKGVRIASTGVYLPSRVVTNDDLVRAGAPLTADEMLRLSGIEERRHVDDEATSDLAIGAARQALERASLEASAVDRLIVGTVSPDHMSPSAACFVQHGLGLGHVPAFDVTASCSGFLYAIELAARSVATGDSNVLAVAADVRSKFIRIDDRATCALFGDGAAAALVCPGEVDSGLIAIGLLADGAGSHSVYVPAGGSREPASASTVAAGRHAIRMEEGPKVYLAAVEGMIGTAERLLAAVDLEWDDIDMVVPHQPNRRILARLSKLAGIAEDKIVIDIEKRGNMSGASVGAALDRALRERAKPGDRILLVTAGAGYTAGAALLVVDQQLLEAVHG
jgi:3-oxoacyl-[acyl-carrier-protein] synthase-3